MPGKKAPPGATPKQNRQYEHIKDRYIETGKSAATAKELAAKTVNSRKPGSSKSG